MDFSISGVSSLGPDCLSSLIVLMILLSEGTSPYIVSGIEPMNENLDASETMIFVVTPQSLESQEDLNFKERLGESKEELGESERDPGRGVSDRLGEWSKVTRRVWSVRGKP